MILAPEIHRRYTDTCDAEPEYEDHSDTTMATIDRTRPRWQKNLYVLFVAELISVTGFLMVVPFLSLYIEELDVSFGSVEFWAGMSFSVLALTRIVAGPIWGALADRFGRKVMVQRAMFGGAVLLGLMAFVHSAEQLVAIRAMQGIVTGTVVAANTLVAASAPSQRNGYAMGLMQTSVWIGAAIGPLLGGVMADAFGFRPVFYLTAMLLMIAGVAVTFFVHEEYTPPSETRLSGREMLDDWLQVLQVPRMWEILSMRLLVRVRQSVLLPFLPLFVALLLPSQERASTVTGLAAGVTTACGAFSAAYLGRLGDRIGHERLLQAGALGVALGYILMALIVTQGWQLILLSAVAGIALGGVAPSIKAMLNQVAPDEQMGSVYGLDSSVTSGGRVAAPLLGSAMVGVIGLRGIFVLLAAMFGLLVLLTTLSQRMRSP